MTIYTRTWGTPTSQISSVLNTILFASMDLDTTATGLYYDEARFYSTSLGTFVTQDPIGYSAGDTNLYCYCGNNPMSDMDPTGLKKCYIKIFAGHDYQAIPWVDQNAGCFGDGTYGGVCSCHSRCINKKIGPNQIPGIGGNVGVLWFKNLWGAVNRAILLARTQARNMCAQHRKGSGKDSDCESVTITVEMLAGAQQVMNDTRGKKEDLCGKVIVYNCETSSK